MKTPEIIIKLQTVFCLFHSLRFLIVYLSTAGTTTKTQMKKRMRRSLKRRTLRKMKRMRKRTTTKPWDTVVSISENKINFRFHKIVSAHQLVSHIK